MLLITTMTPGHPAHEDNKATTAHVEDSRPPEKAHHGDTALAIFAQSGEQHGDIDPAETKRLVRKIDYMVLPFLSICYAFYYVRMSSGLEVAW